MKKIFYILLTFSFTVGFSQNTTVNETFTLQQLSSSDYWFVIELTNGKTEKGHFSLLR